MKINIIEIEKRLNKFNYFVEQLFKFDTDNRIKLQGERNQRTTPIINSSNIIISDAIILLAEVKRLKGMLGFQKLVEETAIENEELKSEIKQLQEEIKMLQGDILKDSIPH